MRVLTKNNSNTSMDNEEVNLAMRQSTADMRARPGVERVGGFSNNNTPSRAPERSQSQYNNNLSNSRDSYQQPPQQQQSGYNNNQSQYNNHGQSMYSQQGGGGGSHHSPMNSQSTRVDDRDVNELVNMGFSREQATAALLQTNNNVEMALDRLLNGRY